MIRGMSREKPALVFLRCIDIAWSLYEIIGDRTMKIGARMAVASVMSPIVRAGEANVAWVADNAVAAETAEGTGKGERGREQAWAFQVELRVSRAGLS